MDCPDQQIARMRIRCALFAVIQNKPEIAREILKKSEKISTDDATKLLWEVVTGKKDAAFVELFAKKGANLNDAHKGKALLISAVEVMMNRLWQHCLPMARRSI